MEGYYITNNLFEAAYLNSKGMQYKLDTTDSDRVKFVFTNVNGIIDDMLERFWKNSPEQRLLESHRLVKKQATTAHYKKNYYKKHKRK
jgi:hypothetical protein